MVDVKDFMEDGFKFIIPPPKYHPHPNLLPLLDPSFCAEKMAADTPYHRVPEDAGRDSLETIPGDDQRLLDPLYDDDDDRSPPPPKRKAPGFKISYHPTFYLRLAVLILFTVAFLIFVIAYARARVIPTIVFLAIAIVRNIIILYFHLVGHWFIRIRIEIVGRAASASTPNAKPKKSLRSCLPQRLVQVAIDWILIAVLITTTILCEIIIAANICAWIALPLYALSTIDMGRPSRLHFVNAVSFDVSKEKDDEDAEDAEQNVLPRTYSDVEASGGLHGEMTRKTGADSPPVI